MGEYALLEIIHKGHDAVPRMNKESFCGVCVIGSCGTYRMEKVRLWKLAY